jgi:DNA-binding NtrC family response regulator
LRAFNTLAYSDFQAFRHFFSRNIRAKPKDGRVIMAKILIADDDPSMVVVLSEVLKSNRHEVIPANSAERALQLTKDQMPDVALADIEMPEGKPTGLELLRQIKEYNRTIPVIMITGQSTDQREVECLRAGAYDYIKKPFRVDEVIKRVEHALFQQKPFMPCRRTSASRNSSARNSISKTSSATARPCRKCFA